MEIIVTGAAGFTGSNLPVALNQCGETDCHRGGTSHPTAKGRTGGRR